MCDSSRVPFPLASDRILNRPTLLHTQQSRRLEAASGDTVLAYRIRLAVHLYDFLSLSAAANGSSRKAIPRQHLVLPAAWGLKRVSKPTVSIHGSAWVDF